LLPRCPAEGLFLVAVRLLGAGQHDEAIEVARHVAATSIDVARRARVVNLRRLTAAAAERPVPGLDPTQLTRLTEIFTAEAAADSAADA
jgi:hypothetical protein